MSPRITSEIRAYIYIYIVIFSYLLLSFKGRGPFYYTTFCECTWITNRSPLPQPQLKKLQTTRLFQHVWRHGTNDVSTCFNMSSLLFQQIIWHHLKSFEHPAETPVWNKHGQWWKICFLIYIDLWLTTYNYKLASTFCIFGHSQPRGIRLAGCDFPGGRDVRLGPRGSGPSRGWSPLLSLQPDEIETDWLGPPPG